MFRKTVKIKIFADDLPALIKALEHASAFEIAHANFYEGKLLTDSASRDYRKCLSAVRAIDALVAQMRTKVK